MPFLTSAFWGLFACVFTGADLTDEQLQAIDACKPGNDGARLVKVEVTKGKVSQQWLSNPEKMQALKSTLMDVLEWYCQFQNSRSSVDGVLRILRRCSMMDDDARSNIPSTFSEVLGVLRDLGVEVKPYWEYDMCLCGFIYRYNCTWTCIGVRILSLLGVLPGMTTLCSLRVATLHRRLTGAL